MNKYIEKEISFLDVKKISEKNKTLKNYIKTFCLFRIFFLEKDEEKKSFYTYEILKAEKKIKKEKNIFEDALKARNILIKIDEKDLKKILNSLEEN